MTAGWPQPIHTLVDGGMAINWRGLLGGWRTRVCSSMDTGMATAHLQLKGQQDGHSLSTTQWTLGWPLPREGSWVDGELGSAAQWTLGWPQPIHSSMDSRMVPAHAHLNGQQDVPSPARVPDCERVSQPRRARSPGAALDARHGTHMRSGRCRCRMAQKARPSRNEVVMLVMLTSR